MTIWQLLLLTLWIIFVAFWAISAVGVKRNVGARVWWRGSGLRLAIIVLVLLALRVPALRHVLREAPWFTAGTSLPAGVIGVALCALGIGLAIWARRHLGRNWGMPMSRKEDPELVTTGPYAHVRHPIYSGMLLAMLGSAIGGSPFWLLPFVLSVAYFICSARIEEKLMLQQFPAQYAAYMKRTKMLVPFVL